MAGKFIFVSGLSGAGKSTMVRATVDTLDNCVPVVTCTTRPRRVDELDAYEYHFATDAEYESLKAASHNWDETIYASYKYGTDGEKYMKHLQSGVNVIVAVAPDMRIITTMAQKYGVKPVTIWINTDEQTAHDRIKDDSERSSRNEVVDIMHNFEYIFHPTGDLDDDSKSFIDLIGDIIANT